MSFESPTSLQENLNGDANVSAARKSAQAETTFEFGGTRQQITFACDAGSDANCFEAIPALNTESRLDFSARSVVSGANEQLLYGIDLARGTVRDDAGGTVSVNPIAQAQPTFSTKRAPPWGRRASPGTRGERTAPSA